MLFKSDRIQGAISVPFYHKGHSVYGKKIKIPKIKKHDSRKSS
jgi:hypothetical protein